MQMRSHAAATCVLAAWFLLHARCTHASEGDTAWPFHACVWRCSQTGCTDIEGRPPVCGAACPHINRLPVALALRMAGWSCEDDCRYLCMLEAEQARGGGQGRQPPASLSTAGGGPKPAVTVRGPGGGSSSPAPPVAAVPVARVRIWKYFGKWPFVRLLGAQELASVLLSLCNLVAHVQCGMRLAALCCRQGGSGGGRGGAAGRDGGKKGGRQQQSPRTTAGRSSMGQLLLLAEGALRAYPYLPLWLLYAVSHINAWLWSAVFHIRLVLPKSGSDPSGSGSDPKSGSDLWTLGCIGACMCLPL